MRLCPCRNRVYDREVWKRIFVARESDDFKIRQEAKHAIHTLLDNGKTDSRSLELLLRLPPDLTEDLDLQGLLARIGMHGPQHRPTRKPINRRNARRWDLARDTSDVLLLGS